MTGSLYDGGDAIEQSEKAAAAAFGAGLTAFSGGGCTLCIQAMLALAARRGRTVLMARNAHRSALHAAALLGLSVIWLTDLSPSAVDAALSKRRDICTVYITSPDYYGRLADIRRLSAVCKQHGAALLVDNAHGSHLGAFGLHPLALGADMTADSAHKTLPVLTGGAYLHLAADGLFGAVSRREIKRAMALFGSTSPSFPVLASLDLAQAWWQQEGAQAFRQLSKRAEPIFRTVTEAGFAPQTADGFSAVDPVRVTLDCKPYDALAAAERLRAWGCEPEYADSRYVVLLLSPFHAQAQLDALSSAIASLAQEPLPPAKLSPFSAGMPDRLPKAAMSLREALLRPFEEIDTKEAAGRVAAQSICPCPPGVAAVASGEIITQDMANKLLAAGVTRLTAVAE